MTFWRFIVILATLGVGYHIFHDTSQIDSIRDKVSDILTFNRIKYRQGMLVANGPTQVPVNKNAFANGKYSIKPVAYFSVKARVLAKERYFFDRESSLSPYDIVVGWRQMSDQTFVDNIGFSQGLRIYSYSFDIPGFKVSTISHNSANIHIIPANEKIAEIVGNLKNGDMVLMVGYLVTVTGEDGWVWRSSLLRDDLGEKSGELLWLDQIQVLTDSYPKIK